MAQGTAPAQSGVKMTIRVYRVDRHGIVSEDRGTVAVAGGDEPQAPATLRFPPCSCPRCRAGQPAR